MASAGHWPWRCQGLNGSSWLFLGVACPSHQFPFPSVLNNVFCAPWSWGQVQGHLFHLVHLSLITPRTFLVSHFSETHWSSQPWVRSPSYNVATSYGRCSRTHLSLFCWRLCSQLWRENSHIVWCLMYALQTFDSWSLWCRVFLLVCFFKICVLQKRN